MVKKRKNKWIFFSYILFGIVLCLSKSLCAKAEAKESDYITYINPIYADVIIEDDIEKPSNNNSKLRTYSNPEYVSVDQAADNLRKGMVARNKEITVYCRITEEYSSELMATLFQDALGETGEPTEGDYLRYQYNGFSGYMRYDTYSDHTDVSFYYTISYRTTAEQEEELSKQIESVLSELPITENTTDYRKIQIIYSYIVSHVSYDHANPDTYRLKYTAYAALCNQTAVCEGYSLLLYRMLREVGISVRVVTGDAGGPHAWNIASIDGMYYYLDATWDHSQYAIRYPYKYFLKGDYTFEGHLIDLKFLEDDFASEYPLSGVDYAGSTEEEHTWDDGMITAQPTCSKVGNILYYCDGCKSTKNVAIPKLPHQETIDSGREATCEHAGYTEGSHCSVCNEIIKKQETIPKLDHKWGDGVVIKEARCDEEGEMRYTCESCNETKIAKIAKPEHTWDEGVVTKEATFYVEGECCYTCEVCKATKIEKIEKLTGEKETLKASYAFPMYVGLTAKLNLDYSGNKLVTLISSDESALTIDSDGTMHGHKARNNVKVTASAPDADLVYFFISVKEIPTLTGTTGSNTVENTTYETMRFNSAYCGADTVKSYLIQKLENGSYIDYTNNSEEEFKPNVNAYTSFRAKALYTSGMETPWYNFELSKSGHVVVAPPNSTPNPPTSTPTLKAPSKPKITSISTAKKKLTVKWKKVSGASGYVIYRSTKKKSGYKKVKTITKGSTVKWVNTKLKAKKTYYYKIKAYKKAYGQTKYSRYSEIKNKKTK